VTHTGLDELTGPAAVWAALPLRAALHLVWWRIPRQDGPLAEDAVGAWIEETWSRVDAWIEERQQLLVLQGAPQDP